MEGVEECKHGLWSGCAYCHGRMPVEQQALQSKPRKRGPKYEVIQRRASAKNAAT